MENFLWLSHTICVHKVFTSRFYSELGTFLSFFLPQARSLSHTHTVGPVFSALFQLCGSQLTWHTQHGSIHLCAQLQNRFRKNLFNIHFAEKDRRNDERTQQSKARKKRERERQSEVKGFIAEKEIESWMRRGFSNAIRKVNKDNEETATNDRMREPYKKK